MVAIALRRTALVLGCAGIASAVAVDQLPAIAEWKLRRELAERGFPDARFRVVAIELDRLALADVELAPGLVLGSVELDAGLSLLWRDPSVVRVRGARVAVDALPSGSGGGGGGSIGRVEIADSTLVVAGNELRVAGALAGEATDLDLSAAVVAIGGVPISDVAIHVAGSRACAIGHVASARIDACATRERDELAVAWTADDADGAHAAGRARLAWSGGLAIRAGSVDATSPRWRFADLALAGVGIRAEYAGPVDALAARGVLQAGRASGPEIALTDVELPFEVHLRDGTLSTNELVANVRRATGSVDGRPIDATDVLLRRDPLVRSIQQPDGVDVLPIHWFATELRTADATLVRAGGTIARDHSVGWHAAAVTCGGIRARDAAGVVARDGSITWRAGALTASGARLAGAAGTIAKNGAVRWRATRVTTRDARLDAVTGTMATDRWITWRARSLATKQIRAAAPAGTIDPRGVVRWRASVLNAGGARLIAPRGTVHPDDSIDWTADRVRWGDWIGRAPSGHVDTHEVATIAIPNATRGDLALAKLHAVIDRAWTTARWRAASATYGSLSAESLTGKASLESGSFDVAWQRGRYSALAFGKGAAAVTRHGERWTIQRGHAAAYGGTIALARPARADATVELDVRGLALAQLLRALPGHGDGSGVLDGKLVLRDGKPERLALAARHGGHLRFGDRVWLAGVVKGIAQGDVAVIGRITGSLADFEYTRLGILLTPDHRRDLQLDVRGRGRRVAQELDLVINIRGLRNAVAVLTRRAEESK